MLLTEWRPRPAGILKRLASTRWVDDRRFTGSDWVKKANNREKWKRF